eukprot:403365303
MISIDKIFPTLNIMQQPLIITELCINNPLLFQMIERFLSQNQFLTIKSISIEQNRTSQISNFSDETIGIVEKIATQFHTRCLRIGSLLPNLAKLLYEVVTSRCQLTQLYINGDLLTTKVLSDLQEIQFKFPRQLLLIETSLNQSNFCQILDLIQDTHSLNLKLYQDPMTWMPIWQEVLSKISDKSINNLFLSFDEKSVEKVDTLKLMIQLTQRLNDNSDQIYNPFKSFTLNYMHFYSLFFDTDQFIELLKQVNYKPDMKQPTILSYEL